MTDTFKLAGIMLAGLLFLNHAGAAQPGAPFAEAQADRIFEEFGAQNKPAIAIALLKNKQVVYLKAFGQENLEYKVAATIDTQFQIDALAWEFIAFAVLQLQSQGKLGLDDDARKYVPQLPDFGKKITVAHLLSSTDGLYGYRVMKALAGWQPEQAGQTPDVMRLVKHQAVPNFEPGTAFSPGGDTRLFVLAKIVEVVSGLSFADYCKQHIFIPIGMSGTVFVSGPSQPLNRLAVPYRGDGKGAYRPDYGVTPAGPGMLYSTIRDMATWRSRHAAQATGRQALAVRLDTPIRLDNGKVIKDMSSISTFAQQHAGKERGIAKIYQAGSAGAYASSLFHFPDQDVTVITLSSGLAYNGSYGMRTASLLMESHYTEPATIDYASIARAEVTPAQLEHYVGSYWSAERALAARIHLKAGVLHYTRTGGTADRTLIPLGDGLFQMQIEGDDAYFIQFSSDGNGRRMAFSMSGSDPVMFEAHAPLSYAADELAQFAGVYHSELLNSSFAINVTNGVLVADNVRTGPVNLTAVKPDVFVGDKSFLGGIAFIRGQGKRVTAFEVMVDEVRKLRFGRIDEKS